jgi:hypothetical protein
MLPLLLSSKADAEGKRADIINKGEKKNSLSLRDTYSRRENS